MNTKIKFYSEGADWSSGCSVPDLLLRHKEFQQIVDPDIADMVIFNGGSDIGTSIYNEKPCMPGIPYEPSKRDTAEVELFDRSVSGGKFILGICRGAQLVNCLNGGSLWQHVDNHGRNHDIYDIRSARILTSTSTHHQMMRPTESAEIIAVASCSRNKHCEAEHRVLPHNGDRATGQDVEICWYDSTRSLCIQGHPEYVPGSDFAYYCVDLIKNKYNKGVILSAVS